MMSLPVTGGSKSTIDRFETEDGWVLTPNNERIAYADLAENAASIAPSKSPKLKPAYEWLYLGKSQPRLDHFPNATGTAECGMDTRVEAMLFATIRMTPRFSGTTGEIYVTTAKAMAGVKKMSYHCT